MRRSVLALAALAWVAAACSSSSGGAARTTVPGSGAGGSTATTVAGPDSTSDGSGTGASTPGSSSGGTGRTTTVALPTTTPPSRAVWIAAHRSDLATLHTALGHVDVAFNGGDDEALSTALIECANAVQPLARTAGNSLPPAEAGAFDSINKLCPQMVHDIQAGDRAAMKDAKPVLDTAVAVVQPMFP